MRTFELVNDTKLVPVTHLQLGYQNKFFTPLKICEA